MNKVHPGGYIIHRDVLLSVAESLQMSELEILTTFFQPQTNDDGQPPDFTKPYPIFMIKNSERVEVAIPVPSKFDIGGAF